MIRLLVKQCVFSMYSEKCQNKRMLKGTLRQGSAFCISINHGRTEKGGRRLWPVRINRQKHKY